LKTVNVLLCSEIDPGLEEAISTVIWVAPRLCAEVQELREVYIVTYAVVVSDLRLLFYVALWCMFRGKGKIY